jgi:hypothetical protein
MVYAMKCIYRYEGVSFLEFGDFYSAILPMVIDKAFCHGSNLGAPGNYGIYLSMGWARVSGSGIGC